jgi:hypothetical protein
MTDAGSPLTPQQIRDTRRNEALVAELREPVDQGGYDGYEPDGLHIAAADHIEQVWMWLDTERTIREAWEKRAYEAEAALTQAQQEIKRLKATLRLCGA